MSEMKLKSIVMRTDMADMKKKIITNDADETITNMNVV